MSSYISCLFYGFIRSSTFVLYYGYSNSLAMSITEGTLIVDISTDGLLVPENIFVQEQLFWYCNERTDVV